MCVVRAFVRSFVPAFDRSFVRACHSEAQRDDVRLPNNSLILRRKIVPRIPAIDFRTRTRIAETRQAVGGLALAWSPSTPKHDQPPADWLSRGARLRRNTTSHRRTGSRVEPVYAETRPATGGLALAWSPSTPKHDQPPADWLSRGARLRRNTTSHRRTGSRVEPVYAETRPAAGGLALAWSPSTPKHDQPSADWLPRGARLRRNTTSHRRTGSRVEPVYAETRPAVGGLALAWSPSTPKHYQPSADWLSRGARLRRNTTSRRRTGSRVEPVYAETRPAVGGLALAWSPSTPKHDQPSADWLSRGARLRRNTTSRRRTGSRVEPVYAETRPAAGGLALAWSPSTPKHDQPPADWLSRGARLRRNTTSRRRTGSRVEPVYAETRPAAGGLALAWSPSTPKHDQPSADWLSRGARLRRNTTSRRRTGSRVEPVYAETRPAAGGLVLAWSPSTPKHDQPPADWLSRGARLRRNTTSRRRTGSRVEPVYAETRPAAGGLALAWSPSTPKHDQPSADWLSRGARLRRNTTSRRRTGSRVEPVYAETRPAAGGLVLAWSPSTPKHYQPSADWLSRGARLRRNTTSRRRTGSRVEPVYFLRFTVNQVLRLTPR